MVILSYGKSQKKVMDVQQVTRLTASDLKAIDARLNHVLNTMPEPTIDSLKAEGYQDHARLHSALDAVRGAGTFSTLLVAELLQSGAVLIIGIVFAILEFSRVYAGAQTLGQHGEQASLIAFAVVTANVVHPIYHLRSVRGQDQQVIRRMTLRGYLMTFWHRVVGKPRDEAVDWTHNSTLGMAAWVITITTVILAILDLLEPILRQLFDANVELVDPMPIVVMKLLVGLGLSLSGVYFLQAAAHEIGVRTLIDQPMRLTDLVVEKQQAYQDKVASLREQITSEHMQAKLADAERKAEKQGKGKGQENISYDPLAMNGHGAR